jgi:hypothetical protein
MTPFRSAKGLVDRIKSFSPVSTPCSFVVLAAMVLLAAVGAKAVSISGLNPLPGAVSYESIGFNFVEYSLTSSTVGTLTYAGGLGCGGICTANTQLGPDPSASLNVNAVVFDNTCCGGATAELGYYVELAATPGLHTVNVDAPESISITDALSNAFAYLAFGPADGAPGTLNDFASYTLQEADCVNFGCQDIPVGGVTHAPFIANNSVEMEANIPYFVLLDMEIRPSASGLQQMVTIDPQFSTTEAGDFFVYSAGVTDAMPEPGALVLMLSGFALLCGLPRQGRRE